MAVWAGPHLYSQTQINHVVLSEVHVLQNSCLITVKGYIAGRMNHDVDSHSSCTFTVRINPDRTAKERRVSCRWREKHRATREKPARTFVSAAGAEGTSRRGSVLELLGAHIKTRLIVVAGHGHMGMFRTWVLCHPPVVTSRVPQGGWFHHLNVASRAKAHRRTAFTWMVWT